MMSQWKQFVRRSPESSTARAHRRRGSVMILVITLLSILFVLGVAFLATMNFESQLIDSERAHAETEAGVEAAEQATDRVLSDGILADGGQMLASSVVASSKAGIVDLPDYHALSAPIEPYRVLDPSGTKSEFRYRWYTDTEWLMTGKHEFDDLTGNPQPELTCRGGFTDTTGAYPVKRPGSYTSCEVVATGLSFATGEPPISGDPGGPGLLPMFKTEGDYVAPVDVDGDGIRDSFQVNVKYLGLSEAQQRALAAAVNTPDQARREAFLGLRIVPHGGMVNLNDAHPRLIETVFDLGYGFWPNPGDPPDANLDYFVHAPTQATLVGRTMKQEFYPPAFDEPALRRRGFLPPVQTTPSRLHGNAYAAASSDPVELLRTIDIQRLFPPVAPNGDASAVFRFWPMRYDEEDLAYNIPLFDVRMDPYAVPNPLPAISPEYDRRHLTTTTSHDDLLSRGADAQVYDAQYNGQAIDMREMMEAANKRVINLALNGFGVCPDQLNAPLAVGLPFEYPDYPESINDDVTMQAGTECVCSGDPDCHPDFRKGRLQLSLSWLDRAFLGDGNIGNYINRSQRDRLIYDTFAMMIANVVGRYRDTKQVCNYDPVNPPVCPNGSYCRFPTGTGLAIGSQGYCTDTAPYWDTPSTCTSAADCGPGPYDCVPVLEPDGVTYKPRCVDTEIAYVGQGPGLAPADVKMKMLRPAALISRAAAELTANLIDYVDKDEVGKDNEPTRIALRSFDFTNVGAGQLLYDTDYRPIYVYGVERQPYITEVTTNMEPGETAPTSWAVELFNPFDQAFPEKSTGSTDFDYWIAIAPPTPPASLVDRVNGKLLIDAVAINKPLPGRDTTSGATTNGFTVLYNGNIGNLLGGNPAPPKGTFYDLSGTKLEFVNKSTVYLLRRMEYPNDTGGTDLTWIVLDQVKVGDVPLGAPPTAIGRSVVELGQEGVLYDDANRALFSSERIVSVDRPWTAPIPDEAELAQGSQTLGNDNSRVDNTLHPVEVSPAQSGLFAKYDDSTQIVPQVAFPTTGSMLLITRHANHALRSFNATFRTDLAFTRRLVDTVRWQESLLNPNTTQYQGYVFAVNEKDQIDNGRMPVFDRGKEFTPWIGSSYRRASHHVEPEFTNVGKPGGASTLPWGQFVFDYFTALPLSNPGPYRVGEEELQRWWAARPRVDMNGLRVHGRIDLNAAPWTVLRGVPYIPIGMLPAAYQERVRNAIGSQPINDPYGEALKYELAQAIVGYREARSYESKDRDTGNPILMVADYGDGDPVTGLIGWRGWNVMPPYARRGTGFLTVGELANVRHKSVVDPAHRMDSGYIAPAADGADYVRAVAGLVALSDWVTVKSHVFTVYGAVRGSPRTLPSFEDPTLPDGELALPGTVDRQLQLDEIDNRAIRFQETIDRLPMLLDEDVPRRIGGRTTASYTDFTTD